MTPVFNSTVTDEIHGDKFENAVTRAKKIKVFAPSVTELEAQPDDSYKEVKQEMQDNGEHVEMPYKATYSIEYWGSMAIKNSLKFKSRDFTKNGSGVFEIDFNEPETQRQWENAPDNYNASLQTVIQWHFRTKVLGV